MALRDQYQRLIDKKRAELEECRGQIRAIEAYIMAMQDAMKLLPREAQEEGEQNTLRVGTKLAKAREFLLQKGRPQHINIILSAIGDAQSKEARVALTGSLGQYARAGRIFTKTGSNEFGLLEFASLKKEEKPVEGNTDDDIPF